MKFKQQLENNKTCRKFRENKSRYFSFRAQNLTGKFGEKKRSHLKTAEERKKVFYMVICLKISFYP